jgi:hypothetical protein
MALAPAAQGCTLWQRGYSLRQDDFGDRAIPNIFLNQAERRYAVASSDLSRRLELTLRTST